MTRTTQHPSGSSLTSKLVAGLAALNAGFCFGGYVVALFSEHFFWALADGTNVVINVFSALVALGRVQVPKITRFWRRPAALLLGPLDAQHNLVRQSSRCLFCHQTFAVGEWAALVPLDLKGCEQRNMALAAHALCVEVFIKLPNTIGPTQT